MGKDYLLAMLDPTNPWYGRAGAGVGAAASAIYATAERFALAPLLKGLGGSLQGVGMATHDVLHGVGVSDIDINNVDLVMWEPELPGATAAALENAGTYFSARLGAALNSSRLPILGVGVGGLGIVTAPRTSEVQGLAHLTNDAAALGINESGILRGPIYASNLQTSALTGLPYTARTGVSASQATVGYRIPDTALSAFSRPVPIGPATAWQRWGGTSYTAGGFLDLETGTFVETGVNWNQVGLYSLDTAITGTTIAGVGLGIYVFGGD